jgi:guanylate kinase
MLCLALGAANHDGEDSENWDAFYFPIGDARHSLMSVVSLLNGAPSEMCEQWEADLLDR